jgi:hypothetical protein
MKNILLLSLLLLTFACCKDPKTKPEEPPYQEYTSFVVWHNSDVVLTDCFVAWREDSLIWHVIDTVGNLTKGIYSPEIVVDSTFDFSKGISVFTKYNTSFSEINRLDTIFYIKEHIKNIFFMTEETRGIGSYNYIFD